MLIRIEFLLISRNIVSCNPKPKDMKIKLLVLLVTFCLILIYSCTKKGTENFNAGGNIPSQIISILPNKFNPSSVTYYKGTYVTFSNLTDKSHKLLSVDSTINSGTIEKGKSYTIQFLNTGIYDYKCTEHTGEVGTVQIIN